MVKLDLLSPNLALLLTTLLQNQNICKYLYYNTNNPLAEEDIADTSTLMFKNFLPTPFDPEIVTDDTSTLRVFYLRGDFTKEYPVGVETKVFFDIVVNKQNWLINDGTPKVRPYEIMSEIVNLLDDQTIGTLGKLHFQNFAHLAINLNFDGIRLTANMNTLRRNGT